MRHTFKYQCTRRPAVRTQPAEENCAKGEQPFGAGSGGNGKPEVLAQSVFHKGYYSEIANVMQISATRLGGFQAAPVLSLIAASDDASPNGRIEAHGSQGVRLTTGLPQMPPAAHETINGVEIVTGDTQQIDIIRGFTPATCQSITLAEVGINIDAGIGPAGVVIGSDVSITLQVGAMTKVTLTPAGIIVKGPIIQIN
jgi:hypothetical protein